jgi:23S rRNA (uracil1939-C5)-methyltransferase
MADLYAGAGTFAAFLGGFFPGLDLVEENREALALARQNLAGTEARFFGLSDTEWAEKGIGGSYGFVVADPPRSGLSPALRSWLIHRGPPLLAYISCDPASLARDCRELCKAAYSLESLDLFDFYPQTAHIESLGVLRRR